MRVSATHIVLETGGQISDPKFFFYKVYEMSDGEYMVEMDGQIHHLQTELFHKWEEEYKDFIKLKLG
jgi:hypothetical protein